MKDMKIALLIDVDNVKIGSEAFKELYAELQKRGDVVYSKFYGYNDRKHIYLSDLIAQYGYETAPFMRFKKRFSQLDTRIIVDAVKLNYTKPEINGYAIVAGDGDLIPLLVELKSSGRHLMDINSEYQHINAHMFDEHITLPSINKTAEVYTAKTTKAPKVEKPKVKEEKPEIKFEMPKPVAKPAPVVEEDEFEKLQQAFETEEDDVEVEELEEDEVEDEVEDDLNTNLSQILRNITSRYNDLDFSDSSDMPKKLQLIKDIEDLIESENAKGEGVYSSNADIRQIFTDLQDVVDDMKSAL